METKTRLEEIFAGRGENRTADLLDAMANLLVAFRGLVGDDPVLNLAAIRAAQMSHCVPSLAAHVGMARLGGEHTLRLYHLSAWRDSTLFGPRERAALGWAEAMVDPPAAAAAGDAYEQARCELCDDDIWNVSLVVALIGLCSRLNFGSRRAA